MKTATLPEFLTDAQLREAIRLYELHGDRAVSHIQAEVIEPNMAEINRKLGQENDARYVAYMVVAVFEQAERFEETN